MAITEVRSETDVKTVQANFATLDARTDGLTAAETELATFDGGAYAVTTTATPATGSVGVQFIFKQVGGATSITVPFSSFGYICTAADGLTSKAVTSVAALTNGRVLNIPTVTSLFQFTSTAAGLLGLTITASAGSYYVAFILPNGKIAVSTVCTIN